MKKCKACKSEIDSKATKCPKCGADQRIWFRKHPILTVILAIVLIAVISGIAGSGKGGSSSSNGNSNTTASQPSGAKTGKVGQTVADGDLAFTVNSVTTTSSVGNSYVAKTAQGIYYVISVKIDNNGKDTKTINASDFNVVDNQGRKFDYSNDGQMAMEESTGTTDLFLQQIQPGLSITGKIIFDVPKDATGLRLLAQGGLFTDGVSIDLGK